MSNYIVDTSALAKRYVIETGSAWVRSWALPRVGNTIVISRLSTIEIVSFLMRRYREGALTIADVTRVRSNFFTHVRRQYTVVELDTDVFSRARRLLVKHPLRALDAIQLAWTLEGAKSIGTTITFVSAGMGLLAAAFGEGLTIDDPNAHP